jgi:hypothetical protein
VCALLVGSSSSHSSINAHFAFRQEKKSKPMHKVAVFSNKTATSTIRKHLYENHLTAWVKMCDQLKILITAQGAMHAVTKYRLANTNINNVASINRRVFSNQAFVESIAEWIVADDQVTTCCYFVHMLLLIISWLGFTGY